MATADDLVFRLRRIYAALGEGVESDLSEFPAKVVQTPKMNFMFQDFRGGLTPEQLVNLAYSLIHQVFNLRDNLKKWAEANGRDAARVKDSFGTSESLKIMADLSNAEKHGLPFPPNHPPWSGRELRLGEVNRVMRIAAKPGTGWTGFTVDPNGQSQSFGRGNQEVVLTADVLDPDGSRIGDVFEIAEQAISDWEKLLLEFGITF